MFIAEESPNVRRRKDAAGRVNDRPRDNYMFFYHPAQWGVDYRGRLMPQLSQMSKGLGVGAVNAQNGDFLQAEAEYRRRGFIPIPHDVLGEDEDYVAAYRNRKGQRVCRSIFQAPHQSSPEEPTSWAFDQEAYDAFIEFLREAGHIKPPRPEVVRAMLRHQRDLLAAKKSPRTDDGEALERYRVRVERIRTAIATLEAELEVSVREYGQATSPGRSRVLAKLMASRRKAPGADEAPEAEADGPPPPTPKARASRKRKAKAAPAPAPEVPETAASEAPTDPTEPPELTADGAEGFVADDDGGA